MSIELKESERERFQNKWKKQGDCHVWQGALDRDGYGTFHFRGAARRAHRFAYAAFRGPIPEGYVVNHICRNRACVNPQHLNCVTPYENSMRDSTSLGYVNSQKGHCPKGHPYDGTETWQGRTQRICTICRKENQAAAARRRREEAKKKYRI